MDYSFIPSVAKQKVRTITYKMKDVFEKKTVPASKKNKVISKVKKVIS